MSEVYTLQPAPLELESKVCYSYVKDVSSGNKFDDNFFFFLNKNFLLKISLYLILIISLNFRIISVKQLKLIRINQKKKKNKFFFKVLF